jgi:ribose 5-phosphate isomerase RpiB
MENDMNKYTFIRVDFVWNVDIAKHVSTHSQVKRNEVVQIVDAYLDTPFESGHHLKRISKIVKK